MKMKLEIMGLDCPNCAAKLAGMMEKCEGIDSAKINFLTERLTIETELDEAEALAILRKTASEFEDGIEIK